MIKRIGFAGVFILLFAVIVSAESVSVEIPDEVPVLISELDNPAVFDIKIERAGRETILRFFRLKEWRFFLRKNSLCMGMK